MEDYKEYALDNFELSLLKQLEEEHKKRNGTSIKECGFYTNCWFTKMRDLILKDTEKKPAI